MWIMDHMNNLRLLLKNTLHEIPLENAIRQDVQNFFEIMEKKLSVEENADCSTVTNKHLEGKQTELKNTIAVLNDQERNYEKNLEVKNKVISENEDVIRSLYEQHKNYLETQRNSRDLKISVQNREHSEKMKIYTENIKNLLDVLNHTREQNLSSELQLRFEWKEMKMKLKDVITKYYEEMEEHTNRISEIKTVLEGEKELLNRYQAMCIDQESEYVALMAEKESYLENVKQAKLAEIRRKIASRKIVKFVEEKYPAWKKKKLKMAKKKKKRRF